MAYKIGDAVQFLDQSGAVYSASIQSSGATTQSDLAVVTPSPQEDGTYILIQHLNVPKGTTSGHFRDPA